jgi:hypothetical protein
MKNSRFDEGFESGERRNGETSKEVGVAVSRVR